MKIIISSFLLILSFFTIVVKWYDKKQENLLENRLHLHSAKLLDDRGPSFGSDSPQVHLVVFFDPACESCKVFHQNLKKLSLEFKDHLRVFLRYADFHENSLNAIRILEAARKQNKFEEALEILFEHQEEWGGHHQPQPDSIWVHLQSSSLDLLKLKEDFSLIDSQFLKLSFQDDLEFFFITQTPTVFLERKPVLNLSYDDLKQMIEKLLSHLSISQTSV